MAERSGSDSERLNKMQGKTCLSMLIPSLPYLEKRAGETDTQFQEAARAIRVKACAKDVPNFLCACPKCLDDVGLTLIYNAQDEEEIGGGKGERKAMWRVRVVSLEVANLAPHLICSGYTHADGFGFEVKDPYRDPEGSEPDFSGYGPEGP